MCSQALNCLFPSIRIFNKDQIAEDLKAVADLLSDETGVNGKLEDVKNDQEVTEAMECTNAYCNNAQVIVVPAN